MATTGGITAKPIETHYRGHRFRSRLEARWAVFFDTAGIPYEYEKEGFELRDEEGAIVRYLPDFWLPDQNCWVEIKGQQPTSEEMEKAWRLHMAKDAHVVFIFVGAIPVPENGQLPIAGYYPVLTPDGVGFSDDPQYWAQCPVCQRLDICVGGTIFSGGCKCLTDIYNSQSFKALNDILIPLYCGDSTNPLAPWIQAKLEAFDIAYNTPRLLEAYRAARYARFEYGERGRP